MNKYDIISSIYKIRSMILLLINESENKIPPAWLIVPSGIIKSSATYKHRRVIILGFKMQCRSERLAWGSI